MTLTRTHKARPSFSRTITALLLATFAISVGSASAVAAQPLEPAASASVSPIAPQANIPVVDDTGVPPATSSSKLIPMNRWSSSTTNLHFRANDMDPINTAALTVKASSQSGLLSWIGTAWWGTASLSDLATNLEPLNMVGYQIDQATASLGSILLQNPLIFTILGFGLLLGAIWNKSRGRDSTGLLKRVLGVVLVMTAIGAMSAGAAASTNENGQYRPGLASPGWVLTTLTSVVGGATNGALSGISGISFSAADGTDATIDGSLSCTNYVAAMKTEFEDRKLGSATSKAAMSMMWETSGLRTWVNAQFGANNKFVDQVWCHRADQLAGVPAIDQMLRTVAGVEGRSQLILSGNFQSKAWIVNNEREADKTMFAWAACQWTGSGWSVQSEFQKKIDGVTDWITASHCRAWWETSDAAALEPFNVGTGEVGADRIEAMSNDEGVLDFSRTWQGTDLGLGTTTTIVWAIVASIILFLILGVGLSGAILVAKILSVVMIMTMMLVLIASLFTREGAGPRVAGMLKQVIGYTVLAAGASALFLIVTWMTQLLISLGSSLGGAGTVPSLIWTAMAPVAALVAVHIIFKKVFKTASPITPGGALAWGAAGGAAGGFVGGALANRLGNIGRSAVDKSVRNAGSSALHSATGGRFGRAPGAPTRTGAGAPPPVGGNTGRSAEKDGVLAGKAEMDAARDYARDRAGEAAGTKIPTTAQERANMLVHKGGAATATALGNGLLGIKNIPQRVSSGARDLGGSAKFLAKAMTSADGRAVIREVGSKAAKDAAVAAGKGAKRAAANTVRAAGTAIKQSYSTNLAKTQDALAEKAAAFAANPVASTWRAAKTITGVGAVGLAAVVTGGAALPVAAAVVAGRRRAEKREVRATEDKNMLADYRSHLEAQSQASAAEQRVAHDAAVIERVLLSQDAAAQSAGTGTTSADADGSDIVTTE